MTAAQPSAISLRRQAGLSLIELMVGMAIGLVLLAALGSLYVSSSKARAEFNKTSEQVENGRYALESVVRDVEMAGFWGQANLGSSINYIVPDPCAVVKASMGFDTSAGLQVPVGVAGLPTTAAAPTCLPNIVANSEVLTVRYASSISAAAVSGNDYFLQLSRCRLDAVPLVYDNATTSFTLQTRTCSGAYTEIRKYVMRTYYLASCDDCTKNDGIPTLKVAEFNGGAITSTSLVTGIQDVHYSYGVDTDKNGAPDCYVDNPAVDNSAGGTNQCPNGGAYSWASSAANWANVTAVRISVLSRNLASSTGWVDKRTYDLGRATVSGPYNDSYKRHVYNSTARVWNIGGQREIQ
ncbi:PilW family protein [Dyella jiangningensis]|uniref:Pilus assembly protein PilW n=1 Tax=Dyella jiangningensis TaxID=1379159 RepID=A0A328P2V8_9GAMM|nr:PilW family protein [Dyella jiangningensis]RAO76500.1 pilus assembly protein PilW [Dyella jiangningensis]